MKTTFLALLVPVALLACSKNEPEAMPASATTNAAAAATSVPGVTPAPTSSGALASILHPALLDPSNAKDKAPDVF